METLAGLYVVGVSGGIDSMVLLDQCLKRGLDVIVCHVNYHLRKESDDDQRFVEAYCLNKGVECLVHDAPKITGNIQGQARVIRYQWMATIVKERGAQGILVGHQLNDCLETYLMQKERGLVQHYGILKETVMYGVRVIRPMLHISRDEIEAYAKEYGVTYVDDLSNFSLKYRRNQKREMLKELDLDALMKQMVSDNDALEEQLIQASRDMQRYLDSGELNVMWLRDTNPFFWQKLLAYHGVHIALKKRTYDLITRLLMSTSGHACININKDVVIERNYDQLMIVHNKTLQYEYLVNEGELLTTPYFSLMLEGDDRCGIGLTKDDFPLIIRTMRPGDKISLTYGHKKVSRLFIDAKIPYRERQLWPLVFNRNQTLLLIPKIAKNKHQTGIKCNLFVLQ